MVERTAGKVLLVVACCFVLLLLPVSSYAQKDILEGAKKGIEKGAEGVKKGAETVGEKTKEGAETVGKGVKNVFTDDDKDTNQDESYRAKPGATQSTAPTGTKPSESTSSSSTERHEKGLPKTAGELPLLALVGLLALASSGALKVVRRLPKDN